METNGVPEPLFWCDDCQEARIGDHCAICHVGACELCGIPMVDGEQSLALGMAHATCVLAEEMAVKRVDRRARRRRSAWQEVSMACWSLVGLIVAAGGLGMLLRLLTKGGCP